MIEVNNLVKNYTSQDVETKVLRGVSLSIPKGQFVSIIGPSGAGKSTLLYQMSLLDGPTSGTICIDGEPVESLSESEATRFRLSYFGFVFQDYSLVPELTALENVIVPSLMLGSDYAAACKEAIEMLEAFEVAHAKDHLPSQMSGGEQQRVSVARAVARKPKILFADEPTASLDTKRSLEVLEVLKRLNRQGQTIVMVTHEPEFAHMSHRIIELKDGVIVSDYMVPA